MLTSIPLDKELNQEKLLVNSKETKIIWQRKHLKMRVIMTWKSMMTELEEREEDLCLTMKVTHKWMRVPEEPRLHQLPKRDL